MPELQRRLDLRISKTAVGGDLPVPLSHRFLELPPPRQRLAADDLVAALDAQQGNATSSAIARSIRSDFTSL